MRLRGWRRRFALAGSHLPGEFCGMVTFALAAFPGGFCGMVPFAKSGLPHAAWSFANVPGGLAAAPLATPAPPDVTAASRCPWLIASGFGSGEIRHPAFLTLTPHPCGLPRPAANASAVPMGEGKPITVMVFD